MATKKNIRSIRFSDEIAALIDQQIGDTFTQKFENLVTKCVWELPEKEKQLERAKEMVQKEKEHYLILHKQCGNYSYMLGEIGEKLIQVQEEINELIKEP